jgi:hypothetical protein
MKITILGSCRQEPLSKFFKLTTVKNAISYPHYTKEILEVIKFCKYGHLTPEETLSTFRTSILNKKPIHFTSKLKNEFDNSQLFIVEIASRKTYQFQNRYVHHILYDNPKFNTKYKDLIKVREQNDDEIENDIIKINEELNKRIILVSHIVMDKDTDSKRFKLVNLLEKICLRHNILFLNPSKEIIKKGYNVSSLVEREPIIAHYNKSGIAVMQKIYKQFVDENQSKFNFIIG